MYTMCKMLVWFSFHVPLRYTLICTKFLANLDFSPSPSKNSYGRCVPGVGWIGKISLPSSNHWFALRLVSYNRMSNKQHLFI